MLAFDEEEEWKVTRLSRLLAAGRFVVCEVPESTAKRQQGGGGGNGGVTGSNIMDASTISNSSSVGFAAAERASLESGVAFAGRSTLAAALVHFLRRTGRERRAAAREGQRLFARGRDEATILAPHVYALAQQ